MKWLFFSSLFFTGILLAASLSHLFALPNKINLSANEYLVAQHSYRGWALLGIAVILAIISVFVQLLLIKKQYPGFGFSLGALIMLLVSQVLFWMFTFPANQQTKNWTVLPDNWQQLRLKWEYSHAVGAILDLVAFFFLILSALKNITLPVKE
jgi:hypothetical protein